MQEDKKLPQIQIVDLQICESVEPAVYDEQSDKAVDSLRKTGCLFVRDARITEWHCDTFLSMLEEYFASSDGVTDTRPELHYQVGLTPSMIERARDHCGKINEMADLPHFDKPLSICPPELDPKWRFLWRVGSPPKHSRFPQLNQEAVIPPDFPQWRQVMDDWGTLLLNAATGIAQLLERGFGLPCHALTSRLQDGAHLLAPTGSDLQRFGKLRTVLAGFHYDLNFLSIHGKSRFPGLYVWLRDGRRMPVRVPAGCLLVQAGKQMEYLTGGQILAGFHEVVVAPETIDAIERRKASQQSLWRVSSTLFSHIASDEELRPLGPFATEESLRQYPPIAAGEQVMLELEAIGLKRGSDDAHRHGTAQE